METLPATELTEGLIFKGEVTQHIIDKSLNIFSFMCVGYYTLKIALMELNHDVRGYNIGWVYTEGFANIGEMTYIFSTVGEVDMTQIEEPQIVTFIVKQIIPTEQFDKTSLK